MSHWRWNHHNNPGIGIETTRNGIYNTCCDKQSNRINIMPVQNMKHLLLVFTLCLSFIAKPQFSRDQHFLPCLKINFCSSANIEFHCNEEFGEYLQGVILSEKPILITRGFNFHVDDCSDKDAAQFKDLLLVFGLQKHVNVPTHIRLIF